jgi:hypothetical protein
MLRDSPESPIDAERARWQSNARNSYPRIYRMKAGWLIFLLTAATISLAVGLLGVALLSALHPARIFGGAMLLKTAPFVFIFAGAYTFANELTAKIILYADEIKVVRSLSYRCLRRDEIAGSRVVRDGLYSTTLVLYPRQSGLRPLKISPAMQSDATFTAWIEALPNLDLRDSRETEIRVATFPQEIATDERLGAEPTERIARLELARRQARAMNWLARGVMVWCLMLPHPYGLSIAVTAVVPWIAIYLAATSRGTLRISVIAGDPHPNLIEAFVLPAIGLVIRAAIDDTALGWTLQFAIATAGGVGMTVVIVVVDHWIRPQLRQIVFVFAISTSYQYGATALANELFDHSTPRVFRAAVIMKPPGGGDGGWHLRLGAWGPSPTPANFVVQKSVYDLLEPGWTACVWLRQGALSIPWYTVQTCDSREGGL